MLRTTRIWLMLLCVSASGEGFAVGGEFSLTSADGSSYSLANSRGKVVVLSFGYTFCPDVCPTALGTIGTALNRLTEDEVQRIDALFVSLDPDRDTPERLREYTRSGWLMKKLSRRNSVGPMLRGSPSANTR